VTNTTRWAAAAAVLLLTGLAAAQGAPENAHFDIILRNGTVIDGTGALPFRADVGISGAHIARVGDLSRDRAKHDIDVTGLYVAPGFINLHSHASPGALATAENMLTQGVTTEIVNADGGGRTDIAAQLAEAASAGLALNVGAYIGFNSAWTTTVGEADRRATATDIARMREILVRNLEHGAWGVSAGLDYKPAYYATAEEVVEVVKAAAPWRTNFTNHDRLTPETKYSSRAAVAETIGIGSRAGLVPVITHMKVQGREQGTAASTLGMMRDATARGNYTAADVYPYLAGQTGLGALLVPGWAQDGGREQMLERFKDASARARIVAEVEQAMDARFGGPAGVFLPASRRELVDVVREMNVSAGEAVVRLLEAENQGAILRFGSEADLIRILQHPTASVACDCGASLPSRGSHPRNQGSYPRVLGRYVRELQALTWEDAIRKMTLLPATIIGMVDRGAIAAGMAADVTVFDPATVADRATYDDPSLPSEGIRHVLVNGVIVLRAGMPTGARPGRVLARGRHMPSRPMSTDRARRLSIRGTVVPEGDVPGGAWQVTVDLSQTGSDRAARGTLRLRDAQGGTIEARALGVLQVARGWAGVTAWARADGEATDRALLVLVDERDPLVSGSEPIVRIVADGLLDVTGRARVRDVRIR
jgi:N-acyl-D-amino-acid deacylase